MSARTAPDSNGLLPPARFDEPCLGRYVAMSSGPKYYVIGLGRTPDEAKAAAFRAWKRQRRPVPGVPIRTVAQFEDYFGFGVFGPLSDGQGISE